MRSIIFFLLTFSLLFSTLASATDEAIMNENQNNVFNDSSQSALVQDTTQHISCVFSWLESKYSQYYAPASKDTSLLTHNGNSYRYYATTDSLLVYNPTYDRVYSGYNNQGIYSYIDLGSLPAWISGVGCSAANYGAITLKVHNTLPVSKGFNASLPLKSLFFTGVSFNVNGVNKIIPLDVSKVATYDQLNDALQAGLTAAKTKDPTMSGVTITQQKNTDTWFSDDGQRRTTDAYVVNVAGGSVHKPAGAGWGALQIGLPSEYAISAYQESASSASNSSITLRVHNTLPVSKGFNASSPLKGLIFTRVSFDVNGVNKIIPLDMSKVATYDQLNDALQAGLTAAKLKDPAMSGVMITQLKNSDTWFSDDGQPRITDTYLVSVAGGSVNKPLGAGWGAPQIGLASDYAISVYQDASTVTPNPTGSYKIGDKGPSGGIVFNVDTTSVHGLEAQPTDYNNGELLTWSSAITANTCPRV